MSTFTFEGPIEGYVVNFLRKNYWKVERTVPRDDVMQEAHVVYLRCKRRYPDVEDKHFMALFKTAWSNHFTDLANEDTERRCEVSSSVHDDDDEHRVAYAEPCGATDNDGMLSVLVQQAPREVSMVLNLFLNAPQELLDLALSKWRENGRYLAGGSKHVTQMLGLPADLDVLKMVEDHFCQ